MIKKETASGFLPIDFFASFAMSDNSLRDRALSLEEAAEFDLGGGDAA